MKNPAEATSSLVAVRDEINRELRKIHWAHRPVSRAEALAYPRITWRPCSVKERRIVCLQDDHITRSRAARKGWLTRLMHCPLSLQLAAEIKMAMARARFVRSRAARVGWMTRRAKFVLFPVQFANAA